MRILRTGCSFLVFCLFAISAHDLVMEDWALLPARSCQECGTALCAFSFGPCAVSQEALGKAVASCHTSACEKKRLPWLPLCE